MVILGIDTSSTDLSICLSVDGSPVSTICRYVRNSHAEHITQAVKLALELGGIDAGQISRIAISIGPGSFTGLRIGLSFVKGFCMMTERKVIPLSSLMALAHAVNCRQPDKKIFTALDARQGRVHWSSFVCGNNGGDSIKRLTDDRLTLPEELLSELSPNDILIIDRMGYSRSTVFTAFAGKAQIIDAEKSALTRASACAALAFDNRDDETLWQSPNNIVPNYLQPPATGGL
ncbi:MAG: tRNA (adenosine(37)-N6)-threonylcarbamoyltransferase complex dimerization subunit type 1 TsaB [Chitinispirillales bacterium]|jgi:tRNA threonylcarbamoyladenosine biosynthesis protein TsaB|nr:tRNA (adenosine(37)-N6)-threonylcarbamoyltransferase complex dimerization subunit type 1 TsaB [Chitinispirillales bacterium]